MVYHSSKFAQRRKKILIWKISLSVIFIILIVWGTSSLSRLSSLQISNVVVQGDNFINKEEVKSRVEEHISGNYFLGYSRSNFLLFPRGHIKDDIKNQYSALKNIQLNLSGTHTLKMVLDEYQPKALWCRRTESRNCYLVNEDGLVFLPEPLINEYDFFEMYDVISEGDILGQSYVSADFFHSIIKFEELLSRLEIKFKKIETEDGHTFTLTTGEGTRLIFDVDDNVVDIFDNLQTVIDQDAINKAQFSNIDYIDLRFGNRVFYKIK
ncbi:hypothetical protein H6775_02850 [Candidatus Nomurabacteria bacterium]|nr:hypothetical protein [Candidatus Nomurabacteria bacterium]